MKTLHLLRHAKSDRSAPSISDRERGLNARGLRASRSMGHALSNRLRAMRVITSPARRAQLTLEGLCSVWSELAHQRHVIDESLYTFSGDDLVCWLQEQDDGVDTFFLIGHNPALTELINHCAPAAALENLPTAGDARLVSHASAWRGFVGGDAQLADLLLPRSLEQERD